MRTIFRKAMTVLGSVALIGSTIGAAAAANFPSPFTSNSAIVVGNGAAPSDLVAATSIASTINEDYVGSSVGTSTTVSDGDSYKFEKSSTKFHLGDTITGVVSSTLDEDEMPILLNDGTYVDSSNDEFDYTQTITMAASRLVMFEDNDYAADEPTIGFHLSSGDDVLTYTISFNDEPDFDDMESTDLNLMGRDYYVLSADYQEITLLDSASDTILAEGETATLDVGTDKYVVSINFIGETTVKLEVNGEKTNSLSLAAPTYKLKDGSYIGLKDILYTSKESGVSKVEFSIGNGKLVLTDGDTVELNEDDVDGLTVDLVNNSAALTSISLDWNADDDLFITEDMQAVMPGFGAIQLVFGGLDFPEEEEIMIGPNGDETMYLDDFPLKDSVEDIPLLYSDGTDYIGIGKDADELLRVDNDGSITFNGETDAYFVLSWSDGRDAESYLMRATDWGDDGSGNNQTTFQYRKDNSWVDAKVDREEDDTFSVGNAEVKVGAIHKGDKTVVIMNNSEETDFQTLYSKEGMMVYLPFNSLTSTAAGVINISAGPASWNLTMVEEDKDGDKGDGSTIRALLGINGNGEVEVSSYLVGTDGSTERAGTQEIDDSDVFEDWVYSDLATKILFDRGPDQKTLKLIYHGDEVAADVFITSSDAVISGGGDAGIMTVTDNNAASVSGKNLVVVGGSAINSVAASLLGSAYRGPAFTTATGVGDGEFLIQSFSYGGATALLVAGYNAADTTKAASYLTNYDVDTTVGKKYKGTSATEATSVVA
jgi:hypothetical protein